VLKASHALGDRYKTAEVGTRQPLVAWPYPLLIQTDGQRCFLGVGLSVPNAPSPLTLNEPARYVRGKNA